MSLVLWHGWLIVVIMYKKILIATILFLLNFLNIVTAQVPKNCNIILDKALCAKIGQMLVVGFGGMKQNNKGEVIWTDPSHLTFSENSNIARTIAKQHIGGVILFSEPLLNRKTKKLIRYRNIESPLQLQKLTSELIQYSKATREKQKLPPLPLFISIDQEGGQIAILKASHGFPQTQILPQALGLKKEKAGDDKIKKARALKETTNYAANMATLLHDNHINVNFAPVVDVNINPTNPIIGGLGRSFSSDPQIVINQAQIFIHAFHQQNIIAALKHFPGHGSSSKDTHKGLVNVTDTYNLAKELKPYTTLINSGYADIIMSTHVINGQIDKTQCREGPKNDYRTWCPATMSYKTLTELLRHTLDFKGIIVSDDMTMGAITKEYSLSIALEKSINAGVDMLILANHDSDQTTKVINTIAKLVKNGRIKKSRIEDAYQRIVRLKKRLSPAANFSKPAPPTLSTWPASG